MKGSNNDTGKTAYIFFNRKNVEVTHDYLSIIQSALKEIGYSCEFVKTLNGIRKDALIVFAVGVDAFKYYFKGYHNIMLWQQGASGAESYLKHNSRIRRLVLNRMDCFVMKKAKMIFYVSEYMLKYYEKMAHARFAHKAYVMPCFNEVLDRQLLERKDYSRKVFTYIGSLSAWQCFNETAETYARIEKRMPDAFFKVLTFNTEQAEAIIREKNIKNYSVACVPKDQVKAELEGAAYGFIIRHDIDVNRVATPTKISSYLSAGVLPVYSTCLKDFHAQAQGKSFAYALNPGEEIDSLIQSINRGVDKAAVRRDIEALFNTYYSAENHTANIVELAKKCLE